MGRASARVTRHPSVAAQLKNELAHLMRALTETKPYFVRCIKPNENKSASEFNSETVLRQLKCLGVLEAISIQQNGFPFRMEHVHFVQRHW